MHKYIDVRLSLMICEVLLEHICSWLEGTDGIEFDSFIIDDYHASYMCQDCMASDVIGD